MVSRGWRDKSCYHATGATLTASGHATPPSIGYRRATLLVPAAARHRCGYKSSPDATDSYNLGFWMLRSAFSPSPGHENPATVRGGWRPVESSRGKGRLGGQLRAGRARRCWWRARKVRSIPRLSIPAHEVPRLFEGGTRRATTGSRARDGPSDGRSAATAARGRLEASANGAQGMKGPFPGCRSLRVDGARFERNAARPENCASQT